MSTPNNEGDIQQVAIVYFKDASGKPTPVLVSVSWQTVALGVLAGGLCLSAVRWLIAALLHEFGWL